MSKTHRDCREENVVIVLLDVHREGEKNRDKNKSMYSVTMSVGRCVYKPVVLVLTTVAASTVPGLMEIAVTSAVVLAAAPVFKKAAPVVNEAFADLVEEATELVVKTAKKTGEIVVKAAEVTAEVVEKTAEITADIVMEITTPNIIRQLKKDNNSNTRANENSTNHKENNGNKQSQQNTKTNTQT